jgi:hypothetical protein
MFGSQALETAIGLTMMFFIIATAASMIAEIISRLFKRRATDLESAIVGMLGKAPPPGQAPTETNRDFEHAMTLFKDTSVYRAATRAAGRSEDKARTPSYLSAKAFADAIVEMLTDVDADGKAILKQLDRLPGNLRERLRPLVKEAGKDVVKFKAGLERWFDDTMARAEGAYKRWTTLVLFFIGLTIAVAGNASTVDVAQKLYVSSVTRDAVVDAAHGIVTNPDSAETDLGSVQKATDKLTALQLPVGWDQEAQDRFGYFWDHKDPREWTAGGLGTVFGWLLTALLVALGAPFWFDLLSKLVSLRTAGAKPAPAAEDPSSATGQHLASEPGAAASAIAKAATTGTGPTPPPAPKTDQEVLEHLAEMLGAEVASAPTTRGRGGTRPPG